MAAPTNTSRPLLVTKPGKRAKIAKTQQTHALLTLRALADLGTATIDEIMSATKNRRAQHCTLVSMWIMFDMGLVDGASSELAPCYSNGAPLRYILTDLGRAFLAWA